MRNPRLVADRETIRSGRLEDILVQAERAGLLQRMPKREHDGSRRAILDAWPKEQDVWVFAYGSLIWNPAFEHVGRVSATLYGYHRAFCFWVNMGRGSPENPGLMLGLEQGGRCRGVAYRIPHRRAEVELKYLWGREMITTTYQPKVVPLMTAGGRVPAIAMVINPHNERYAGNLPLDEMVPYIATAEGQLGSCREYLYDTVRHLKEMKIRDSYLDQLKAEVERYAGDA